MDHQTLLIRTAQLGWDAHVEHDGWLLAKGAIVYHRALSYPAYEQIIEKELRMSWRSARAAEQMADILADPSRRHHHKAHAWFANANSTDHDGWALLSAVPYRLPIAYPSDWSDAVMANMCWPRLLCSLRNGLRYELVKRHSVQLEALLPSGAAAPAERIRL